MKIVVPDYYPGFACLMGACRHSCCIGWEIDVDPDMLSSYKQIGGSFGARLRDNIAEDETGAHFRLGEDERCPFLNREGLCDLILELGEVALCQICADHPRYRNFFSDREEIGLGLCCEAAAKLILNHPEPAHLVTLEDDGESEPVDEFEQELTDLRGELIAILQDRSIPFPERVTRMLEWADLPCPISFDAGWAEFFLGLERLDPLWGELLKELHAAYPAPDFRPERELAFEQLTVYLLQRHLAGALEDDDVSGRIAFCALITDLLARLCALRENATMEDLAEFSRMYSSEIEYSDENTGAILDRLHEIYPEI